MFFLQEDEDIQRKLHISKIRTALMVPSSFFISRCFGHLPATEVQSAGDHVFRSYLIHNLSVFEKLDQCFA